MSSYQKDFDGIIYYIVIIKKVEVKTLKENS